MNYDIYLVGVGGQGILTIGDLITEAALAQEIPANYYPTKGMAQRGGFVKAQLRLGRQVVGPHIPEKGADLVIAMELSEALRAVRYVKPGGDFLLFAHVWQPTAVMLGKEDYPDRATVEDQIRSAGARPILLDPANAPQHEGRTVPANIYVLGAAVGTTGLKEHLDAASMAHRIENRWKQGTKANRLAFQAGLEAL